MPELSRPGYPATTYAHNSGIWLRPQIIMTRSPPCGLPMRLPALLLLALFGIRIMLTPSPSLASEAYLIHPAPLRERPSAAGRSVLDLPRRSTVHILETQGGWTRVETLGLRQGWLPRQLLDVPPSHGADLRPADPASAHLAFDGHRRASNHALILNLALGREQAELYGVSENREPAAGIARRMGVPDGNIHFPDPSSLTLEEIRGAFAALEARIGEGDRIFIHLSGNGTLAQDGRTCSEALMTRAGEPLFASELTRYLNSLAEHSQGVFVLIDAGRRPTTGALPGRRFLPAPGKLACTHATHHFDSQFPNSHLQLILATHPGQPAFDGPIDGHATRAIYQCLTAPPQDNFSLIPDGHDLVACARGLTSAATLQVAGNGALAPAPSLPPTQRRTASPGEMEALLNKLHAQRDSRRPLRVRWQRSANGGHALSLPGESRGHLYVLGLAPEGVQLLHPEQAGQAKLTPGALIDLPDNAPSRLLVLLSDAPRQLHRAGFRPRGTTLYVPAEHTSLHPFVIEMVLGDVDRNCLFSETRHLGAERRIACSSAYRGTFVILEDPKTSR